MYCPAMNSFSDIISLWPSAEALAGDLGLPGENPGGTVRAWKRRDNIPSEYWDDLVLCAQRRGFHEVSAELLLRVAALRRKAA